MKLERWNISEMWCSKYEHSFQKRDVQNIKYLRNVMFKDGNLFKERDVQKQNVWEMWPGTIKVCWVAKQWEVKLERSNISEMWCSKH